MWYVEIKGDEVSCMLRLPSRVGSLYFFSKPPTQHFFHRFLSSLRADRNNKPVCLLC